MIGKRTRINDCTSRLPQTYFSHILFRRPSIMRKISSAIPSVYVMWKKSLLNDRFTMPKVRYCSKIVKISLILEAGLLKQDLFSGVLAYWQSGLLACVFSYMGRKPQRDKTDYDYEPVNISGLNVCIAIRNCLDRCMIKRRGK